MIESRVLRGIPDGIPLALAALWPLGIYTQFPATPVQLNHVAALALCVAAVHFGRRHRELRPPFEYWWAGIAALLFAAGHGGGVHWNTLFGVVLFLGASTLIQGRIAAVRGCLAFSLAGTVAALLHASAQAGLVPPTAFDGTFTVAVSGPASVSAGALLVFHSALAGVFVAIHPGMPPRLRLAALGAVCVSGVWLGYLAPWVPGLCAPGRALNVLARPMEGGVLLLLGLWLSARVAARALIGRRVEGHPHPAWVAVLVLAGTSTGVLWGAEPDPGAFLLLGLWAAYSAPWSTDDRGPALHYVAIPAMACVLIQALGWVSLAGSDPRNQAARAEALLAAEDWTPLDGSLDFLLERHPGDPMYTVLAAESLAAQGWPEGAAARFCMAEYPETEEAASGASLSARREALLNTLRDQASRLPDGARGLFFERALVHAGEAENALRFLSLHHQPPEGEVGHVDAGLLAESLARLLGNLALADGLGALDIPVLLGYFQGAGIALARLPGAFPGAGAPLLLRAVVSPDTVFVDAWKDRGGDPPLRAQLDQDPALARAGGTGAVSWQSWHQDGSGRWTIELASPLLAVATVTMDPDGRLSIEGTGRGAAGRGPAAMVLFIP